MPSNELSVPQLSALRLAASGRSFSDVAEALALDEAQVADLVHSASELLTAGEGAALTAGERLRVVDWLLGQTPTEPLVEQSPAAREYALVARSSITEHTGVGIRDLPSAAGTVNRTEQAPTRQFEADPAKRQSPTRHATEGGSKTATAVAASAETSKRGGIALLAVALSAVVLGGLYLFGVFGDDEGSKPKSSSATPSNQIGGGGSGNGSPSLNGLAGWKLENRFYLSPVAGAKGAGLAGLESKDGQRALLAAGTKMDPKIIVGIWLTGGAKPLLIGFQRVSGKGEFSAIGAVPKGASESDRLIVTREQLSRDRPIPTQPGQVLLTSPFKLG